uniref:NADH dehydrogenase subunit 4L n=1 Tax=Odorrana hosii TaxID=310666 RepID=UPI00226CC07C|nr:NADH dehydrogenase subunit 4L [Odorrana hosii]UZC57602.1 NADH dehydrogenase subunit 4L [Odorrana hosii]
MKTPLLILTFSTIFAGLSFHRMHLLSALLCLEGMMLVIFVGLCLWPNQLSAAPFTVPLIMLTMSACEAGLGLSLMVATARSHGTDNLKTLNLLQC